MTARLTTHPRTSLPCSSLTLCSPCTHQLQHSIDTHPSIHDKGPPKRRGIGGSRNGSCSYGGEGGEGRGGGALTVWRRSLLFNGNGFTVFDCKGNLVYRVETYAGGSPRELVLMDADGHGLLTIRRKKLSLADEWVIYDGDAAAASPSAQPAAPLKRFTARRTMSLRPTRSLVHLSPAGAPVYGDAGAVPSCRYDVEGSYAARKLDVFASCSAGERRRRVASVCQKEAAFGPDVFRLLVQPGIDPALAMAVVILLEQMHAS